MLGRKKYFIPILFFLDLVDISHHQWTTVTVIYDKMKKCLKYYSYFYNLLFEVVLPMIAVCTIHILMHTLHFSSYAIVIKTLFTSIYERQREIGSHSLIFFARNRQCRYH